ncbi:MAG: DnaJ domain-containing protein [Pseudomonadota bacterium]|nr:DnaJ domain-containing protein [Pseudomonadota bacterium]
MTDDEVRRIDALAKARTTGSLYDMLGVAPQASPEEVEQAYYDLARQWHPDRFYARDTGERGTTIEENFVAATRAFRTLREPTKRQGYNRESGVDTKAPAPPPSAPEPAAAPAAPPPSRVTLTEIGASGVRAGDTSPGGTRVYEAAPRPRPPPPVNPPPPIPKPPTAMDKVRQQIGEQVTKARAYHDAGKVDFDAGRFSKAESAFYLATKFDPKNVVYAALYDKAATLAREGRSKGYIAQAEQEESYQRIKEAIGWYLKAVECDPPEGQAYYRLALLLKSHEHDPRGAVSNLRKAVTKEPRNITFRLALGELYESLNLHANALREAQAAVEADPRHEGAKKLLKRLKG